MTVWRNTSKVRRFKIWSICLLFVVASASIVFVAHVAKSPSEPFVSVKIDNTTNTFGTDMKAISIQLSNRMSFNVSYWIVAELLQDGKWVPVTSFPRNNAYSLIAHSQKSRFLLESAEKVRFYVSYERQLKPIEISILNKLPWLSRHYPFQRRHSFPPYEIVSEVQVFSESKQQP